MELEQLIESAHLPDAMQSYCLFIPAGMAQTERVVLAKNHFKRLGVPLSTRMSQLQIDLATGILTITTDEGVRRIATDAFAASDDWSGIYGHDVSKIIFE